MDMISVVIPAYNEALNIPEAIHQISMCLNREKIAYELIFVNDGSKDNSDEVLSDMIRRHSHIVAISLSRNFGKEAAIFCGLKEAKGNGIIVMDCDLQHPVSAIPRMLAAWRNGYDVVEGKKITRQKEGVLHRLLAQSFYSLLHKTSHVNLRNASDFKLLDRKVVDALNAFPEKHTFFRALSGWVGFRTTTVEFEVADRFAGQSKWRTRDLMQFALDNLTSFTTIPMQAVTICGIFFFVFAIIFAGDTLYNFFSGNAADGFTTVILLLLIIGSIVMFSLGVIGYYLAKIYEEIQARPRYLIASIARSEEDIH